MWAECCSVRGNTHRVPGNTVKAECVRPLGRRMIRLRKKPIFPVGEEATRLRKTLSYHAAVIADRLIADSCSKKNAVFAHSISN